MVKIKLGGHYRTEAGEKIGPMLRAWCGGGRSFSNGDNINDQRRWLIDGACDFEGHAVIAEWRDEPEAYSEIIEKVNIAEAAFNEAVERSEEEDREIFMQYNNEGAIKVFMQEMHDKAFPSLIYEKRTDPENQPRSKYHRIIKGVELDIYDILVVWGVTCPARQHAIKKLIMAGERGAKGVAQDLDEAIQATERAKELV